ncbi:MAG: hypothetical protein H6779_01385 [Candidatus Nomurabacteria bacterium]|nr:MAG: hypothetical protein H6779_01385 [Candidatus Nomurabacteria bacterium]
MNINRKVLNKRIEPYILMSVGIAPVLIGSVFLAFIAIGLILSLFASLFFAVLALAEYIGWTLVILLLILVWLRVY